MRAFAFSPATAGHCVGLLLAIALGPPGVVGAAVCNVPTVYPTLAAALADATCDPIVVATGTFTENPVVVRSVAIQGAGSASTAIAGWIQVRGAATVAAISSLEIDASAATANVCHASGLDVRGGSRVSGAGVVVVGIPTTTSGCGFFSDGFEGGTLAAWSASR